MRPIIAKQYCPSHVPVREWIQVLEDLAGSSDVFQKVRWIELGFDYFHSVKNFLYVKPIQPRAQNSVV